MHKVVYNACFGRFSLSYEALEIIAASHGKNLFYYEMEGEWTPDDHPHYVHVDNPKSNKGNYAIYDEDVGDDYYSDDENQEFRNEHYYSPYMNIARHDPMLIAAVETLGERANGSCADLRIAEIEGDLYRIDEYDGFETVVTPEGEEWVKIENT